MPQGPDGNTIIIVKKVNAHGGAHGAAWKVAFADFMTSMMALFMVLWLITASTASEREAIANYFTSPSVFSFGGGRSPIEMKEQGLLEKRQAQDQKNVRKDEISDESMVDEHRLGLYEEGYSSQQLQDMETKMFENVAEQLAAAKEKFGNIDIEIDATGMHIDITDSNKSTMFKSGTDKILPDAKQALIAVADIIGKIPNAITVEGHTDGVAFTKGISNFYDNWYLATDRANIARKILVLAGVDIRRIASVSGYADTKPKFKTDLNNPINRRITIGIVTAEDGVLQEYFTTTENGKRIARSIFKTDEEIAEEQVLDLKIYDDGFK